MTFEAWWDRLSYLEQKMIGFKNAEFVWQECQRYTLMTIEDACKAQVAYDQGFKDARERFEVQIAGWTLTPGVQPGNIWIRDVGGEGGDFHVNELAEVIGKFYKEKF
jgi:hypothetical protein